MTQVEAKLPDVIPRAPKVAPAELEKGGAVESMGQWQLIRLAFARHRLAVIGLHLLVLLYLVAFFAEFVAPMRADDRNLDASFCPPQLLRWTPGAGLHVRKMQLVIDPVTLRKTYVEKAAELVRLKLLTRSAPYRLFGIVPMHRHLIG